MSAEINFSDPSDLIDLQSFLERAKRLDEHGAVKLKSFANVLAIYVSPIYSSSLLSGGPTVLGLRTVKLASEYELDATFEIAAILERLAMARLTNSSTLAIPPAAIRVPWSGVTPTRDGWQLMSVIDEEQLTVWAKDGIAEVAKAIPESVGSAVASKVRSQIWGKPVGANPSFPAAAAFALYGLAFMQKGEPVNLYQTAGWIRLSTNYGHVLSKESNRT